MVSHFIFSALFYMLYMYIVELSIHNILQKDAKRFSVDQVNNFSMTFRQVVEIIDR